MLDAILSGSFSFVNNMENVITARAALVRLRIAIVPTRITACGLPCGAIVWASHRLVVIGRATSQGGAY